MKAFSNANPRDTREALSLLSRRGAVPVGGGSDLLGLIKEELASPNVLVNLKSLEGLDGIEPNRDGVRVGGLVTLDALSQHALIRSRYTVLAEAAASVGTPQIRNVGTLAGNICQRPWCWYYRQGFPCFKNGGDLCFSLIGENQFNALFGGGPSFIVHPSDTAPALLALGARIRIAGPRGEKVVPISEFFVLPEKDIARENILASDELLIGVELPAAPSGLKSTYAKIMDREAWTHAVVSVAAALEMDGTLCKKAAIALGGVAPIPWQLPRVESLLNGKRVTPELAAEAGKLAVEGAEPLSKNGYKVLLTETLVRRTILSLAG